ncbi:MAG: AAA family ATPase [Prolixibacteraceae bacterium]|nr:AAA family ATPase [Prolixibacteraceae bacterium]
MTTSANIFLRGIALKNDSPKHGFPFSVPAISDLKIEFKKPVTFLVGENGSGKSTILEAIADKIGFNAMGGTRQHQFYSEYETELAHYLLLDRNIRLPISQGFFFRAESFFNLSKYIDENGNPNYWGEQELLKQSHGESFLAAFNHQFREGLFLLDEPEAALSPQQQLSLLSIINSMEKEKTSQLIIATHSPILLAYPDADIFLLDDNGISKIQYEETEHYQITKGFLDNPGKYFEMLFD